MHVLLRSGIRVDLEESVEEFDAMLERYYHSKHLFLDVHRQRGWRKPVPYKLRIGSVDGYGE